MFNTNIMGISITKNSVFIIDHHRLLRDGLAALLAEVPDIEVVGSHCNTEEAISAYSLIKPEVILMDTVLDGSSGVEVAGRLKEIDNEVRIIFLSADISREMVTAGIQRGISGFLDKNVHLNVLCEAIRVVKGGGRYFDQAVKELVFEDYYEKMKVRGVHNACNLPGSLTRRERQVLVLICSGKSNQEIADDLFISIKTVETHKSHILDKLGLRNKAELVKYAIKNKLINLE